MAKKSPKMVDKVWGLTRISLGLIFLWAFLDKTFGLGYATCRDAETDTVAVGCAKSWLEGGSPTEGFLKFGTKGPFADFFQGLAGNAVVDWLFMLGLLGIGLGLTLGIAMKLAVVGGVVMLMLMYLAAIPPENNPFLDDHVVYSLVLIGLLLVNDKQAWGLRGWWKKQNLVKQNDWLV